MTRPASLSFDEYMRAVSYWHQFADPDGTETSHEKRLAARDVYLEKSFDGLWLGHHDHGPPLGGGRLRGARPLGARAVRGRLGRGHRAPGQRAHRLRPGPDLGPETL